MDSELYIFICKIKIILKEKQQKQFKTYIIGLVNLMRKEIFYKKYKIFICLIAPEKKIDKITQNNVDGKKF